MPWSTTVLRPSRSRELASDARAGSYARALARQRQRDFVRRHWARLITGWFLMIAGLPVLWWTVPSPFLQGVVMGAVVTAASAALWTSIVQASGTAPLMMGDRAEQWTAQEIRKLGRRWRLVNHFTLAQSEVDHVVVGPAGLLVIETKWSAHRWDSSEGQQRQIDAVEQVQRSARQLSRWHEIRKLSLPMRTIVVIWGGHPADGHGPTPVQDVGGTIVLRGPQLGEAVRDLPTDAGFEHRVEAAWAALARHAARRDAHDDFRAPRSGSDVFLQLLTTVVALLGGFSVVAWTLDLSGSAPVAVAAGAVAAAVSASIARRWPRSRITAGALAVGAIGPAMVLLVTHLTTWVSS